MPQGPNILLLGTKFQNLKIKDFISHIKNGPEWIFFWIFFFIRINKACYTCCYKK